MFTPTISKYVAHTMHHGDGTDYPVILHATSHASSIACMETPDSLDSLDLFALSDARSLAETRKTMSVAQRTCREFGQQLQSVLRDQTEMQVQVIALRSQLKQMEEVQQAELDLLESQIQLETQRLAQLQQERDETVRTCNENVAAISMKRQIAIDMAAQANQEQITALEHTQTNAITTLTQTHTNSRIVAEQAHTQALMHMQNTVDEAAYQCREAERIATQKEQEKQRIEEEFRVAKTSVQSTSQAVSNLKVMNSYILGWL